MNTEQVLLDEFMMMVKNHDYSYQFSDDHRSWVSGDRSEKRITELVHSLCSVMKVDADSLLLEVSDTVPEQYIDGLTHKVIRGWFTMYSSIQFR